MEKDYDKVATKFILLKSEIERIHDIKNNLIDEVNFWKEKSNEYDHSGHNKDLL